jgi:peptide/nickel transport system substrate-binding protein
VCARAIAAALVAALTLVGPAAARTAHYGGTITIGTSQEPAVLDPTLDMESGLQRILPNFCLPLYGYASNHGTLELEPILAAAPPAVSADKLTYTIRLRHGVQFNDGTPFDAQAVISSFQRYTTYPGSVRQSDFAGVDSATADGRYAVAYHLTRRNSAFTGNLYPLSPTAAVREGSGFSADPTCVGPFMVDHWDPGVDITLAKSPYYFKRGAVYLDKIVYRFLPTTAIQLNALQAGDIQVMSLSSAQPPTSPSLTVIKGVQLGWAGLVMNIGNRSGVGNPYSKVDSPLAQSPKLRQAFEEAIDRSADVRIAWSGVAVPSCELIPAADTEWYQQTRVPCTRYDPKDAKRLVAASGYPLPITVHLLIPAGGNQLESQVIQSEEAAVGFDVVVDSVAAATYLARANAGNFDVFQIAEPQTDPDPNSFIYPYLDTAGSLNRSGYSSPSLDYVLANALRATDPKARAVDYRVAQQIVHADRPIIVLRENVSYGVFDSTLKGIQFNPFGTLLFANAQYK